MSAANHGSYKDDGLDVYLREVHSYGRLTRSEEESLSARIASGDTSARDSLVCANLRLVVWVARCYMRTSSDYGRLPFADLVSLGNVGLVMAADRWRAGKGANFGSYAMFWIKHKIRRGLSDSKIVHVPCYCYELVSRWRQAEEHLTQALGRVPDKAEIARSIDVRPSRVVTIFAAINAARAGSHLNDAENLVETDSKFSSKFSSDDIALAFSALDPRLRRVLGMRYGYPGNVKPMTLEQVGRAVGLTRERARQIERQAVRCLRLNMETARRPREDGIWIRDVARLMGTSVATVRSWVLSNKLRASLVPVRYLPDGSYLSKRFEVTVTDLEAFLKTRTAADALLRAAVRHKDTDFSTGAVLAAARQSFARLTSTKAASLHPQYSAPAAAASRDTQTSR